MGSSLSFCCHQRQRSKFTNLHFQFFVSAFPVFRIRISSFTNPHFCNIYPKPDNTFN